MKLIPKFNLIALSMSFTFLLFSCTKDIGTSQLSNQENSAKQAVRNIVGSNGDIKLLSNKLDHKLKSLTLSQLQNIVRSQNYIRTYTINNVEFLDDKYLSKSNQDHVVNIKTLTEFEDDIEDGPKPAGYYHVQFYSGSPLNQDLGGFYTLHLYFNTDANGRVIGTPTISYTGWGLCSWQQVNFSNISFNSNTMVSTFTVSGINTYGIQVGGLTLGWSTIKNFLVTINLDELSSKLVTLVEQQ